MSICETFYSNSHRLQVENDNNNQRFIELCPE